MSSTPLSASSNMNSSPLIRATRSADRQLDVSSVASSTRARSPASWPRVSLMILKSSRSSATSRNGDCDRSASAMCRTACSWKPRRLSSPVRSSCVACDSSFSCAVTNDRTVDRSSISAIAAAARSSRICTCSGVHASGARSMAPSPDSTGRRNSVVLHRSYQIVQRFGRGAPTRCAKGKRWQSPSAVGGARQWNASTELRDVHPVRCGIGITVV